MPNSSLRLAADVDAARRGEAGPAEARGGHPAPPRRVGAVAGEQQAARGRGVRRRRPPCDAVELRVPRRRWASSRSPPTTSRLQRRAAGVGWPTPRRGRHALDRGAGGRRVRASGSPRRSGGSVAEQGVEVVESGRGSADSRRVHRAAATTAAARRTPARSMPSATTCDARTGCVVMSMPTSSRMSRSQLGAGEEHGVRGPVGEAAQQPGRGTRVLRVVGRRRSSQRVSAPDVLQRVDRRRAGPARG